MDLLQWDSKQELSMDYRLLLADDSPTIQKVVQITLATEPFEIINIDDEADLFDALHSYNPEVVMLDFSLSESISGYDLCRKIKNNLPKTRVGLIFDSFDEPSDNQLKDCGADAHLIKPFDGEAFVQTCLNLASAQNQNEPLQDFKPRVDNSVIEENPLEAWEMSSNTESLEEWEDFEEGEEDLEYSNPSKNLLEENLDDWGMSTPNEETSLDFDSDLASESLEATQEKIEEELSEEIYTHLDEEGSGLDQFLDRDELRSIVEQQVKNFLQLEGNKIIERVSWEVIPDLAQNLVRKEVEKISEAVSKSLGRN